MYYLNQLQIKNQGTFSLKLKNLIDNNKQVFFQDVLFSLKLFLIDFIELRAAEGTDIAPKKGPSWYKILNPIFAKIIKQLNLVHNSNDISFSLLNNKHYIANFERKLKTKTN